MKILLSTTMALGVVLMLGAYQDGNASASQSSEGQVILVGGGHGHGGGHGGHHGGGHWRGHHGYGGGYWGGGGGFIVDPFYDPYPNYYNYGPALKIGPFELF